MKKSPDVPTTNGGFGLQPQKFSFETLQLLVKLSAKLKQEGFALGTLLGFTALAEDKNIGIATDITPDIFLKDAKSRSDLILTAKQFIVRIETLGTLIPQDDSEDYFD